MVMVTSAKRGRIGRTKAQTFSSSEIIIPFLALFLDRLATASIATDFSQSTSLRCSCVNAQQSVIKFYDWTRVNSMTDGHAHCSLHARALMWQDRHLYKLSPIHTADADATQLSIHNYSSRRRLSTDLVDNLETDQTEV